MRRLVREDAIPPNLETPHLDYGLFLLSQLLEAQDKTLKDFNLPTYQHNWTRKEGSAAYRAELRYNTDTESEAFERTFAQLNTDQRYCFEVITSTIHTDPTKAQFFLQGPAGTVKTFLYRCICSYYRSHSDMVLCVASSGIAALLLPDG